MHQVQRKSLNLEFLGFGLLRCPLRLIRRPARLGVLAVGLFVEHPVQADVNVEAIHVGGQSDAKLAVSRGHGLRKHVGRRGSEVEREARGQAHGGLDAD